MKTVTEAVAQVDAASSKFQECDMASKRALEERQKALEAYNLAMKEMDQVIVEMKRSAPPGTQWHDGKK